MANTFNNFLATDDVPETLFGVPVVTDSYTPEDLEFFRENPKAAGFYDNGDETDIDADPVQPRIVVNPKVFSDKRDALCVAFNEGFRLAMEASAFDPVSVPTEKQRAFFADTAYASDENMLRRTIIARICTFDTSVDDATEEQIQESMEFLDSVLTAGFCQNRWETSAVQRILEILSHVSGTAPAGDVPPPPSGGSVTSDIGGGQTEELPGGPRRGADGFFHDEQGRVISGRQAQKAFEQSQQQPAAGPQRGADGFFHDEQGRVISGRQAQKAFEQSQKENGDDQ